MGGQLQEGETLVDRGSEPWRQGGTVVPRGSRLTPERLASMRIGTGFLTDSEKQLFVNILFDYEGAIAFEDSEMGMLKREIEPPIVIHTVPHEPWQQANLRLPKAMQEIATSHVKEKLANGTLEYSQGPYRSRYFLVPKKKPGEYRFINDVQQLNKVTIRDAGMPPSVDEFSEEFAGYPITTSVDYYSGYYQVALDAESRDLTAFLTDAGLVRMTRLPQGWTNSVACFQRVIVKVHWKQIPKYARPFLDDIGLKGPKSRYNDEKISPGIRRFVWEHAQIFRQFMRDVWTSGMTISGAKTAIGMPGITIVGMVCDADGRHPEQKKVQKILDWPTPESIKDARAFLGIVVYYRIFIRGFAVLAAPIYELFRKGARFQWGSGQQEAMNSLKRSITEGPVLISLDFSPSALAIILNVDASTTIGWGAILSQKQSDGTTRPARFESGIWTGPELKYDALKLECRGLLKALKKLRFWLYGRHFFVETDAQTLVWLLNQPPNDLPNAMMTRWLAYIRLFDFTVKHVPGNKNGGADALSRRGHAKRDGEEDDAVDDYFDAKLYSIQLLERSTPTARVYLHEGEYTGQLLTIGRYLETLERPSGISDTEFRKLRKDANKYLVRDGYLYKRSKKRSVPPRRVIGRQEERQEILKALHDELGHRGRQPTYNQISRRYQWDGMFEDIVTYTKSCDECQRRARIRYEEPLHPTWSTLVWDKVGVDVVFMPESLEGYKYAVFA
jgi:RNase H-like domain found in reverse transcriptase/Integrase zinc binding domain/Reverse transcriptase (RNA-dependent DNA polymerase)